VSEIVFEVTQEEDGGYCAECVTESIFTQGDNWEALRSNAKEAVEAFYFDRANPPP
jgi:predicted RNase H-like HicB family nuclease